MASRAAPASVVSALRGAAAAMALAGSPFLVLWLLPVGQAPKPAPPAIVEAPAPVAAVPDKPAPGQQAVTQAAPAQPAAQAQAPQQPSRQASSGPPPCMPGMPPNMPCVTGMAYPGAPPAPPCMPGMPPNMPCVTNLNGQNGFTGYRPPANAEPAVAVIAAERTSTPSSNRSSGVQPGQPVPGQARFASRGIYQRSGNLPEPPASTRCDVPLKEGTVLLKPAASAMASSVWVGSPEGPETAFAKLFVQPGASDFRITMIPQPTPIVWEFAGDLSRVTEVVVAASSLEEVRRIGFTGIDRARLRFVVAPDCAAATANAAGARVVVPDVVTNLPDGRPGSAIADERVVRVSARPRWDAEIRRTFPNGEIDPAPARILSVGAIGRYEVPARAVGLAKLVAANQLAEVPGKPRTFRVNGTMRFPAGLCGSEAVRFIVRNQGSIPAGDACDSCVIAENSNQPIAGRSASCPE
jgi:hypothetical protein